LEDIFEWYPFSDPDNRFTVVRENLSVLHFVLANRYNSGTPKGVPLLYPCGDSNAGICLRRAALYPLSYRGISRGILMQAYLNFKS
jgi:hypothetical protein